MKILVFHIGDRSYGIDIKEVNSIEKNGQIVSIPNTPEYIGGIVNLRGEIYPVYDLYAKFGCARDTETQELILAEKNNIKMALEVKNTNQMVEVEDSQYIPLPAMIDMKEKYIGGIVQHDGELIVVIKIEELLPASVIERLNHIVQDMKD